MGRSWLQRHLALIGGLVVALISIGAAWLLPWLLGWSAAGTITTVIGLPVSALACYAAVLAVVQPRESPNKENPPSVAASGAGSIRSLPSKVEWSQRTIGTMPALASAFQDREALRAQVEAARGRKSTRGLTQMLSGGAGVGKSQLAVSLASHGLEDNALDLVVWVTATEPARILSAYAQAAAELGLVDPSSTRDTEAEARRFHDWLATFPRPWLLILDDLPDLSEEDDWWWPASHTGTGWVLATTRHRGPKVTAGGRTLVGVDVFEPRESMAFLRERLSGEDSDGASRLVDAAAEELAAALGHLPLGLSHAAAYMLAEDLPCTQYLARFTDEQRRLAELMPGWADTEGYGQAADAEGHRRTVATTWEISIKAADTRSEPPGLARPAARLAAVLDPAGHPDNLWITTAVAGYLDASLRSPRTGQSAPAGHSPLPAPASSEEHVNMDADRAKSVMRLLHLYCIVTHDHVGDLPGIVRMHTLTQRAVIEGESDIGTITIARNAAADAIDEVWPDEPSGIDLEKSLLANAQILISGSSGRALVHPNVHKLYYLIANSLRITAHFEEEIDFLKRVLHLCIQELGPDHRSTLMLMNFLASRLHRAVGRTDEAIELHRKVAITSEREWGPWDQLTFGSRLDLAYLQYKKTKSFDEFCQIAEPTAARIRQIHGPTDERTLIARAVLAIIYLDERNDDLLRLLEEVAGELGPRQPGESTSVRAARAGLTALLEAVALPSQSPTLPEGLASFAANGDPADPFLSAARAILASLYGLDAQLGKAIDIGKQVVADLAASRGPEDLATIIARIGLMHLRASAGEQSQAIADAKKMLSELARGRGATDPTALTARAGLAWLYWRNGEQGKALAIGTRSAATFLIARYRDPANPAVLIARAGRAYSYWERGKRRKYYSRCFTLSVRLMMAALLMVPGLS